MGETAGEMKQSGPASVTGRDGGREGTSGSGNEQGTEELRASIEQTRDEMGETLDAIQEKLDPQHLKKQAGERVREATVGRAEAAIERAQGRAEQVASRAPDTARRARSVLIETVQRYPVATALVGLVLGWLIVKRPGGRQEMPS